MLQNTENTYIFDTGSFLEIFSEQSFSHVKKPGMKLLHFSLVTSGQNYPLWPLRSTVNRCILPNFRKYRIWKAKFFISK